MARPAQSRKGRHPRRPASTSDRPAAATPDETPLPDAPPRAATRVSRAGLAGVAALTGLAATLALVLSTPIHNYDIWWHLSVGDWMVKHHSLYSTELLTYPLTGQAVVNKWGWLCEVLMDLVHTAAGLAGLITLRFLIVVAIVWRLWVIGTRHLVRSPFWVVIVLMAAVWLAAGRLMMRPYLLQYALAVLCIELLIRAKKSGSWRALLVVPLLQVIAINTSQSGLVCLAVTGIFFIGEVLESLPGACWKKKERRLRLLALGLTTLACLAASVASPVGAAVLPVIEYASPGKNPWHASGILKIGEWMSPFTEEAKASGLTWLLMLCLVATVLAILWHLPKAPVTYLLLLASACVFGLQYVRHTLLLGTVGATGLMAYLPESSRRPRTAVSWGVPVIVLGLGLLAHHEYTVVVQPWRAIESGLDERLLETREAARELVARRPDAHVFNTMGLGGALTWFSDNRLRNFADGRLIARRNLEEHNAIYYGPAKQRQVVMDRYGIDALFLDVRPPGETRGESLHDELAFSPRAVKQWEPLYQGRYVVVFIARDAAPPR